MRKLWIGMLAAAFLASCAETEAVKPDVKKPEIKKMYVDTHRVRLWTGDKLTYDEMIPVGKVFAEKLHQMTMVEAKECRVAMYASSRHFELGKEDAFDLDFRKPDRSQRLVQHLTFSYVGFNEVVRQRERDIAIAELGDAPESVKRQILREGIKHTTAESLIWCDYHEMTEIDEAQPSFQLFCNHTDDFRERNRRRKIWDGFLDFCMALTFDYLETGKVDPELYGKSPLK